MNNTFPENLVLDNVVYIPEAEALFVMSDDTDAFREPENYLTMGDFKIVPRGPDNNLPDKVLHKVSSSEVVSSNLKFMADTCYGQGVKPMIRTKVGDKYILNECEDDKVTQFFEDNDVQGFFHEQCQDVMYFGDVFPEIILTKDLKQICSLRSKESVFSRWGVCDQKSGEIFRHFYSAGWADGKQNVNNTTVTDVLNRFNPYQDLVNRIERRSVKTARFILNNSPQAPGKTYYQRPSWWSIFKSGWFDYATMIPSLKKALLKNGMRLRYIIYISPKYWTQIFEKEKISQDDIEGQKARINKELEKISAFISGDKNSGKGFLSTKEMIASGSTAIEEKYLTIESIKVDMKGGEFIDDASEAHSIICYGMGVHHSLIASSFGKSSSTMSGTDKRELFDINTATKKPIRDKLLKPLYLIKRFNKWPKDLVFVVPDYEFTTLDKNPSGKQLNTSSNVNQ